MIVARFVCLALVGLMVERLHSTNAANCVYRVSITTGPGRFAGTRARVFVKLYGTLAVCPWREMKVSHGFVPRSTQQVSVTCPCLGRQRGLRIRHDNSGSFPAWYVRGIVVRRYPGGFLTNYFDKFWLKKGSLSKWVDKSYCVYKVRVLTGHDAAATTSGQIDIKLYGTQGTTRWLRLHDQGGKPLLFGNGIFQFVARCVGYKKKLRIRFIGKGPRYTGWNLLAIGIKHLAPPHKPETIYTYDYYIPMRWMPRDSSYITYTKYKIAVYTGSQRGAGTDANVKIRLYGTITSIAVKLDNPKKDDFERGAIDDFYVRQGLVVGPVTRIRVSHDGSGSGPWWYVKKIYVRVRATFELFKCPCNKWLTTSKSYTYCGCYQVE